VHQVRLESLLILAGEGWPTNRHEVDFDALPDDIFCHFVKKRLFRLQLIEGGNEIDTENTDGFLLQGIRRISQVYVQHNIVRRTARLQLKSKPYSAMRVVRSGVVARFDGIGKGEEASLRAASLAKLCLQIRPFLVQHRLKALFGNIWRAGTVEIVAHSLILGGDRLGDRAASASDHKEPASDFLGCTDLSEGAEGGCREIQGKSFVVGIEFFRVSHNETPVARKSSR